jgi:DNA recombination protein RmuC
MEALLAPIALLLGGLAGWLLRDRTAAQLQQRLELASTEATAKAEVLAAELQDEKVARATADAVAARLPVLESELASERAKVEQLTAEKSRIEAEAASRLHTFQEKEAALTTLRGEIEREIKALASEALKGNQDSFLKLANEVFEKHTRTSASEVEQKRQAIEALLAPMAKTLEEYRKSLSDLERARLEAYAGLANELKNVAQTQSAVRAETSKLVNALRAAPKTRGRWGEHQLHNVLELAGMSPYVDVLPEPTLSRGDERLRPDVIIRLPGNRHIVVDAKTSMDAYLRAVEAADEDTRELCLKDHAQQMRQHMRQLAAKSYWDRLTVTVDFVVMFVPGDNFFAAALERDPTLFEDAVSQKVLITTPTTLVALAKAIAFGWRQEKVADNARRIADLGRDLYRRLQIMGGHITDFGKHLEKTVKSYNGFVGSLEGSVLPQARKFQELEVEGTQEPIPELAPLENDVRMPRPDRDLILATSEPSSDEPPGALNGDHGRLPLQKPTGSRSADPALRPRN